MATTNRKRRTAQVLGDEDLHVRRGVALLHDRDADADAAKSLEGMDHADKARKDLVKRLAEPVDLTPEKLAEIAQNLKAKVRAAVKREETELMVMRFPVELCTDKGRAINNSDSDWPETLTGRPRQAYEFWRDKLKPAGYGLSAMIVEWPGGLPGDVGFFLKWGQKAKTSD